MRLKVCVSVAVLLFLSMVLLGSAAAQATGDAAPEKIGNYLATGSFDMGYRFNSESGTTVRCPFGSPNRNAAGNCPEDGMYDTMVNLHTGGRLLEQTLSLRAPNQNGGLFDDLSVSSFGWGDPNAVARVRISKRKLYDFNAIYRQDHNFFDYDLLANPLNPAGSPFEVLYSPHKMNLARRMSDFNLTIMPESAITFRLGYSRNRNQGPAFSTLHQGAEALLMQNVNTTTDNYRIGVDVKLLKHTKISYDQFLQWYKGDTTTTDNNLYFALPNGTLVTYQDLGIAFNGATTLSKSSSSFASVTRANRYRTHTPTEQLSIESHDKKWDATGRVSYSGTEMVANYNDLFTGWESRTLNRGDMLAGPQNGKMIEASADAAVTYHVTEKLRVSDTAHLMNWRTPAFFNSTDVAFRAPSTTQGSLFPFGSTTQVPDNIMYANFLQTITKWNLLQVAYDVNRMLGVHVGYRYDHVAIVHANATTDVTGGPASSTNDVGNDQTVINTKTGIVGLWFRPNHQFKINADANIGTSDNWEFRTDPRRTMGFNGRVVYTPTRWATISANGNAQEQRNRGTGCDATGAVKTAPCNSSNPVYGIGEVNFSAHNRNIGFDIALMPNDKFGFDLAYNYSNIASNSFICYQTSVAPGTFGNCVDNAAGSNIPVPPSNLPTGSPFETYEIYQNRIQFVDASFVWRPLTRLSANMGYSIVSSRGDTTILNPLQPFGALISNFHRPTLGVELKMTKNIAAKAGWNYYDYGEKNGAGYATLPRDFHDNMTTVSLKYAF